MIYKGYEAVVTFDDQANFFHGEVINTRDVITFQGRTVDELWTAFRESVEDYLEFCKARNEAPEKPFSGKLILRVAPELHRSLALQARRHQKSLNAFIAERLALDASMTKGA